MKILVTGFEPFDGFSVNPSAELAKAFQGRTIGEHRIVSVVLSLDYNKILDEVSKAINEYAPNFILCCGQANRASIAIERIAVNAQSMKRADNYGNTPETDIIDPDGPAGLFSNIDPHPLIEALLKEGIPASVSYHAGIYGCNWLLYKLMKWVEDGEYDYRVTFIHVPPLPSQAIEKEKPELATMPLNTIVCALEVIIKSL